MASKKGSVLDIDFSGTLEFKLWFGKSDYQKLYVDREPESWLF